VANLAHCHFERQFKVNETDLTEGFFGVFSTKNKELYEPSERKRVILNQGFCVIVANRSEGLTVKLVPVGQLNWTQAKERLPISAENVEDVKVWPDG
jgi:hypothetical protein